HAFAHRHHAGLPVRHAVDARATLETHAHAAQRKAPLATQRTPERTPRMRDRRGHADTRGHLGRMPVDDDAHARAHAATRTGSKGRMSIAGRRPSSWSTSKRAVPGAVLTPRPSWPAATQTPERPATRPMYGRP